MKQRVTKTCNKCHRILPLVKFPKTGIQNRYRSNTCRSCAYQKDRHTNPKYIMSRMLTFARLRCEDPNNDSYPRYGGRGIKFLLNKEEFYEKFTPIIMDFLKSRKIPSIDRIDPNGYYEINNIQIIESIENTREMRQRLSERYKQKRILAEAQPSRTCRDCGRDTPTSEYYIKKHHPDGTVTRYNRCPECEQATRAKKYSSKSYYKGRNHQ